MLRVIASYPASIKAEPKAPYAYLNMDILFKYTKDRDAVHDYALKRVWGDGADDGRSKKKRC